MSENTPESARQKQGFRFESGIGADFFRCHRKIHCNLRRPDGGIEPAADTNLRIGAEGGLLAALEAADGGQQSQHPLLDQILTVPAHKEQGAGESAHHTGITADEGFLRRTVPLGGQGAQRLIALLLIWGLKNSHTNLLLIPV